jgi:hypothetical protein
VQGKGLGALLALFLAAALLAGCGGGGDSGQSQSTASSTSAQSAEPGSPPAAVQKLQEDTERVRTQREQTQQSPSEANKAPEAKQGSQATSKPQPPAKPKNTHHDSGGGSSQFAHQGGDNSIQESGTEASETQRNEAAAVLHAYLDARVAGHWDEACFYLSASAVALLEQFAERFGKDKGITTCPQVLEALAEGSSPAELEAAAKADVGSLRTEGDHGFLLYRGAGGVAYAIPMVSEGGVWKVGAVEGTAGV